MRRGDTLHAIAWRFGLDYRDLVKWNRLANPNLIVVGQRLSLRRPKQTANKNTATAKTSNKRSAPPAPAPKKTSGGGPKKWIWPSDGRHELATSVSGSKGLNIFGDRGQPVRAAAPGKVVYSGSGLRGYGQLIIVQHDDAFLSAYAHNQRRLVEEGMQVKRKDVIAHMGDSDAKNVMLHFEIRRNGKPVDPLRFLPSR
ncbi:MAG: peptidoglycan DD-metalloendopeptidase family protein [Pseudomonadota bacterium]